MTDQVTQEQDVVTEAKAAEADARGSLKTLKDEQRTAKAGVATAEKAVKGKEGDELKAAEKAVDAAKDALAKADKAVSEQDAKVKQAAEAVKTARSTARDQAKAARDAEKARKAEERANRPKKAPLTLSQRRALLKLGDAGAKGIVPKTDFNALPYQHLVGVELAETKTVKVDGPEIVVKGEGDKPDTTKPGPKVEATAYVLSATGKERVKEINPKWLDWKPDATPAADAEPTEAATA